jgi:hypothetical protein
MGNRMDAKLVQGKQEDRLIRTRDCKGRRGLVRAMGTIRLEKDLFIFLIIFTAPEL